MVISFREGFTQFAVARLGSNFIVCQLSMSPAFRVSPNGLMAPSRKSFLTFPDYPGTHGCEPPYAEVLTLQSSNEPWPQWVHDLIT